MPGQTIWGVRADSSLGVAHYASRLEGALRDIGCDYRICQSTPRSALRHFHLANSSRSSLVAAAGPGAPYILTIHDVLPRSGALMPLYRGWAWPWIVRRAAAVIVHSEHAQRLLGSHAGVGSVVIRHPVSRPQEADRGLARRLLGWDDETPVAVVPGVIKQDKLVREAIEAARPLIEQGRLRLVLAGRVADEGLRELAVATGVHLLENPGKQAYQAAVVASDVVLVMRAGSVGEANGPLADALGAGRAVVATRTGAIPEYAEGAAIFTEPRPEQIRHALLRACGPERVSLERAARDRAGDLSWEASAAAHSRLFERVWGSL